MKKIKNIFILIICIVLFLTSAFLYKINPLQIQNQEEQIDNIEVVSMENNNEIKISNRNCFVVTSRGGLQREKKEENIEEEKTEYDVYVLSFSTDVSFYLDSLDKANYYNNLFKSNVPNGTSTIESIKQTDLNNLSNESEIINYIDNQGLIYKRSLTYFPTISHTVSSTYGYRKSRGDFHTGIDLCGKYGDNIYSYKYGKVIYTQYSNVSYGNMILVEHEDGTRTRYAHLSKIIVKVGQYVEGGQIIGYMGSTGNSTGNHLHFEVIINGKAVNPYNYIF